jgi:hypothetical protein
MRYTLIPSVLIVAALAAGPVFVTPAYAEDVPTLVFAAGPVVEMLPAGTVVGDGTTSVALHVTAIGPDGAPIETASKWKMSASAGTLKGPTDLGNGVLEFQFTPPAVDTNTLIEFRLKGRAASGTVEKAWGLNVIGQGPTGITATANPERIALGQDTSVSLSIRFTGALGAQESSAAIMALASTGTVTNITYLGNGEFTARYEAPAVNFPQLALITYVDARDPGRVHGHTVLPLVGKANFPVKTDPGSTVLLRIAGQNYGPVTADASGRASIPITVFPGVSTATLVTAMGGKSTEREIDLQVPATARIAMFPTHAGVPADGRSQIPIRALVTTPDGKPDKHASVTFSTTAGTMSSATHEGAGVYMALFTPTAQAASSTATLSAALTKDEGQSATTDVHLVPARAAKIVISAEPSELASGAESFKIFAKVTNAAGQGIAYQQLLLTSPSATVTGDVRDLKGGDYEATFAISDSGATQVGATVAVAPAGNALRHLVLISETGRITPSGTATATLTVASIDEFGYPVPNVPVTLRLVAGDGSVPSQLTTDSGGLAQVRYTAGRKAGIVSILAQSGDITGGTAIIQAPPSIAPLLTLPRSGSVSARSMAADWAGLVTELVVPMAGATVVAPVAAGDGASVGSLATFFIASQPTSAAAGGTVVLRIEGRDSSGRTIPAERPELLVTQGTLSAVQDLGGGAWQAVLTIPADATADTKVVVTNSAGDVTKLTTIPTVASAGAVWVGAEPQGNAWVATTISSSTTSEPADAEEPVPEPAPVAEAAPTDPGSSSSATLSSPRPPSSPWLRAKVGWVGGSYTYAQTPQGDSANNPLWDKPVSLGGDAGVTWQNGFGVDVAAWGDELPVEFGKYLGAEAEFRMAAYRVRWPGSSAVITDWVPQLRVNVMARYPFSAGIGDFYLGIKAGVLYGDFVTYLQGDTEGTIEFGPLGLPGLGLGAEIGADLMDGDLHFQAGLLQGLRGRLPYSTNVDLEISYQVLDSMFVHAGYALTVQSIPVLTNASDEPIGTLSDRSSLLSVGVGYQR